MIGEGWVTTKSTEEYVHSLTPELTGCAARKEKGNFAEGCGGGNWCFALTTTYGENASV